MIRINLLPIKKQQQKETSRRLLILFAVAIIAEILILLPFYLSKSEDVDRAKAENARIQQSINDLSTRVQATETLNSEKTLLLQRLGVFNQLESGRSGPVRILDEVQNVLSQPQNELDQLTFDKRDWSTRWDPGRLWFNEFEEKDGNFRLIGGARTNDDVAEFLQRLSTSVYFENVRLISSEQAEEKDFQYVKFEVVGNLTYNVMATPGAGG